MWRLPALSSTEVRQLRARGMAAKSASPTARLTMQPVEIVEVCCISSMPAAAGSCARLPGAADFPSSEHYEDEPTPGPRSVLPRCAGGPHDPTGASDRSCAVQFACPGLYARGETAESRPLVLQASVVAPQLPSMPKPGPYVRSCARATGARSEPAGSGDRPSGISPHV